MLYGTVRTTCSFPNGPSSSNVRVKPSPIRAHPALVAETAPCSQVQPMDETIDDVIFGGVFVYVPVLMACCGCEGHTILPHDALHAGGRREGGVEDASGCSVAVVP